VPQIETRQTFTLILPNLIHKSKRRNLKKRWEPARPQLRAG